MKNRSKEKLQELPCTHLQLVPHGLNLGNHGFMMHPSEVKDVSSLEGRKTTTVSTESASLSGFI